MKIALIAIYTCSILFIHFRGKARLPFFRQIFDHSSVVAPINIFIYLFSRVPTDTPYLPVSTFPSLHLLQDNWQIIRDEALNLENMAKIKAAEKNDDAGFNSFFKNGWKRFYLKWYGASHPSAALYCPKTVALLKQIPEVKAAMFTELPPGGKLNRHRDPYAGSLRYHLGLSTPNSDSCHIVVNNQPYSWRDGEGVVFDETYLHWVNNNSDTNRLILMCDVERPMKYIWAQAFNRWFGRVVLTAASSPNETGDQTGGISKIFRFFWLAGKYRRKLKSWSRPAYYLVKFGLIIGALTLIIFL
ncbi:MAG: lipid A hydroxylase LpxO [Methylophilaceae bacterium]|nr:lipid A hydroxylase LpxO [Methylophilaceae bacterium]